MALNKKDILLLEEINNNPCSIKYFADKYHVSERNIRYTKYLFEKNITIKNIENFLKFYIY